MPERRPQINFQVDPAMKMLYEEARAEGHWVTRLCAAGFLLMVEDARARKKAIQRLREWESEFEEASRDEIEAFLAGADAAMSGASKKKPAPAAKKKPRRR